MKGFLTLREGIILFILETSAYLLLGLIIACFLYFHITNSMIHALMVVAGYVAFGYLMRKRDEIKGF